MTERLRRDGFTVDLGYSGNVGKRMTRANRIEASVALVLGEDELARGAVSLRDLDAKAQREVPLDTVAEALAPYK